MRKVYRLFGIPVWTVEVEEDPEEISEELSEAIGTLAAQLQTPTEPPPPFGFTPIPFYWDE